jgi:hypothetical protein
MMKALPKFYHMENHTPTIIPLHPPLVAGGEVCQKSWQQLVTAIHGESDGVRNYVNDTHMVIASLIIFVLVLVPVVELT